MHHRSDVLIDLEGVVVCPFHGAQPTASWAAGAAPCGCQWLPVGRDGLRAIRGGSNFASEVAPLADSLTGENAASCKAVGENAG